jgi:hypothetical protein
VSDPKLRKQKRRGKSGLGFAPHLTRSGKLTEENRSALVTVCLLFAGVRSATSADTLCTVAKELRLWMRELQLLTPPSSSADELSLTEADQWLARRPSS